MFSTSFSLSYNQMKRVQTEKMKQVGGATVHVIGNFCQTLNVFYFSFFPQSSVSAEACLDFSVMNSSMNMNTKVCVDKLPGLPSNLYYILIKQLPSSHKIRE